MKGRKPHPFSIVENNAKKQRTGKKKIEGRKNNEPQIKSEFLHCPEHISEGAKKEWERIVKLYKELNQPIITDLDVNALEIYCESLITYRLAMIEVRKNKLVGKIDNEMKANPFIKIANDAATQVKKYGEILLLDPVSRARVGLAKSKEEDENPYEALL
jgi:P27 family predicted phage terminase small subunit